MGYAFRAEPAYDVRHRVAASDGWPLAIYEYLPRKSPVSPPVLLVHGTNARYRIFDNGAGFGLAPYLARHGFHVFALELRGRGQSLPRRFSPRTRVLMAGWSLYDMMNRDLPRAFEFVLAHTGRGALDYVGHSLGGMLAFELLGRTRDERVRRVVGIASGDARTLLLSIPRNEGEPRRVNTGILLAPFALTTPYTPLEWGGKLAACALALTPESVLARASEGGMDPAVLKRFLWHGLSGISAKKFRSFGSFYLRARRGASARLLEHPTLLIAGSGDRTVPAARVRAMAERMAHLGAKLVEFGRAGGHRVDYGHTELLLGRHAEREVFPCIAEFLAEPS
jgi:pimeloyl-ACP methyl ester carboxylesterase